VEVAGDWRRHNKELHNLYASPNIIRVVKSGKVRWAVHVTCLGEMRNVYKVLAGKLEDRRAFGRTRYRWEDNIRMDLRE
jgi:hypothetical protein